MSSAACTPKEKAPFPPILPCTAGKPAGPTAALASSPRVKLGKAVRRNRVRRRIRELYRTNESRLAPGWDVVVVARTRAVFARYGELERSFLQLMERLGVAQPREKRERK